MKKVNLLLIIFLLNYPLYQLFSQIDTNCLCTPVFPIKNPGKVKIDTCGILISGSCNEIAEKFLYGLKIAKKYYTKNSISITFQTDIWYIPPAPNEDSVIIVYINEIDEKFSEIKNHLLQLQEEYGYFYLIKNYPRSDSGERSKIYVVEFSNYINAYEFVDDCILQNVMNCNFFGELLVPPESVEQQSTNLDIIISPNPSSEYIEIEIDDKLSESSKLSESYQMKIYNIFGECILSIRANSRSPLRIDVSHFPNGMYFLRIGNEIQKFVVLR